MITEEELTHQPVTPSALQDWILSPAGSLEERIRNLSQQALDLASRAKSFSDETVLASKDLTSRLVTTTAAVAATQSYIASPSSGWMRSIDRFLDNSGVDSQMSYGIEITPHEGLGISVNSETEISPVGISVVRGIGIPGDNMELTASQGPLSSQSPSEGSTGALAQANSSPGQEPTVTFSSDTHSDLTAMLVDNDAAYFDWEKLYVPPQQRCVQKGTAYVYTKGAGQPISVLGVTKNYGWTATVAEQSGVPLAVFAKPTDPLTLVVEEDFGSGQPMSHLDVTVRQTGGLWPDITSVTVSGNGKEWFELAFRDSFFWKGDSVPSTPTIPGVNGLSTSVSSGQDILATSTWSVPAFGSDLPPVRYVQIAFSQANFYQCLKGIGHPYYINVTEVQKSSSSWFGLSHSSSDTTTTTRLSGPESLVGVQAGQGTSSTKQGGGLLTTAGQILDNPALHANPTLAAVGLGLQVLGSLWGHSSETTKILEAGEYTDIFNGERECISVKRIKAVERQFGIGTPGQMVTGLISFDQAFSAVRLRVDDSSPGNTKVTYDLSFDNGQSWQPIIPTDMALPASLGQAKSLDTPQKTVRLRVSLETDDLHVTPRCYGYALECLPALS